MDVPAIHYARTADDASIAYWVMRHGPQAVVHLPPHMSHLSNEWELPEIASWNERLAAGRTLIRYDGRGTGLSSGPENLWQGPMLDLEAVMDAAGVERAALLAGWVPGAWTALVFAAQHPERVSHLVLWGTSTRGADLYADSITASAGIGTVDRGQMIRVVLHSFIGWSQGDAANRYADALLTAADERVVGTASLGLTDQIRSVNLDRVAARLDLPTLVLHPREAQLVSEETAARLAATIPGAQLQLLDGESIILQFGVADQALAAINSFLGPSPELRPPPQMPESEPAELLAGPPYPDGLSEREVQVLRLVATGKTNAAIAEALVIAPSTAARHVSNILNKTGLSNRTELATYAAAQALTTP